MARVIVPPPRDAKDVVRFAVDVQREFDRLVDYINSLVEKNPSLEIGEVPDGD